MDFTAGQVTFILAYSLSDGPGMLSKLTETCPGQAKFEISLSKGQAGCKSYLNPEEHLSVVY